MYLLTDSLYISLVAIATWAVHRAAERPGPRAYVLAAVVLIISALVRPNGWLLIPIAAIYWIARSDLGRFPKRAPAVAGIRGGLREWRRSGDDRALRRRAATQTPVCSARRGEPERLPFAPAMTLPAAVGPGEDSTTDRHASCSM